MINTQKLNELHPTLQRGIKELFRRMLLINKDWKPALTCAYRGREEQEKAFREGNSTLRFGQSLHNFIPSTAFDIHNNIKGQEFSDKNFFKQAGRIWEEMGGEWGGSWKGFVDMPHFQFTNGRPIKDITSKKYVMPSDTKMKWEGEREIPSTPVTVNPVTTSDMGKPITTNKEKYMLREIKILVNGKEITVPAILFNDQNYIKIQDLSKIDNNFNTGWDNEKRMPIIKTKNVDIKKELKDLKKFNKENNVKFVEINGCKFYYSADEIKLNSELLTELLEYTENKTEEDTSFNIYYEDNKLVIY